MMKRCLPRLVIIAGLLAIGTSTVDAQGTNAPPSNVVKVQRPYYVEGAVVVLLMAAAGVAVCRSSRRV